MKRYILIIITLLIGTQVFAQSRVERMGRKEFDMFSYPAAIDYFERIKNKSTEVNRMLAQSHRFLGNLPEAAGYYTQVVASDERVAEDHWEYAQTLMAMERYTEARTQLERFRALAPNDSRAVRYGQAGDFVRDIRAKESNITIKRLRINGDHQDFGPIYYRDQVIFASSREEGSPNRALWLGNRLPYLMPFIADKTPDGELHAPRPFLTSLLQSDFHVGPIAINRAENMMAVTVNYEKERRSDQTVNLQLLVSHFTDGKWSELAPVPFNDPEYSVGHATFTPDGLSMYFASDMPGGKGGTDIYRVSILDNNGWGVPLNVSEINTESDEMFPFYHENDLLFFSSDGHVGLGGLDVFYTEMSQGRPGTVVNMGYPINSSRDDFGIIIDNAYKSGYFSTGRAGGIGNDDLYYFTLKEPLIEKPVEAPPIVEVIPPPTPEPEPEPEYKPGMLIEINPIYFDFDKANIRPDAAAELDKVVSVMQQYPDMVVELGSHTDCRGTDRYNELLSMARMRSSLRYIKERITGADRISGFYYGKSQLINHCDCNEDPPCSEAEHQKNRRTEFVIISM